MTVPSRLSCLAAGAQQEDEFWRLLGTYFIAILGALPVFVFRDYQQARCQRGVTPPFRHSSRPKPASPRRGGKC